MGDYIEKLSRRRRVALATYGLMFIAIQEIVFIKLDAPVSAWRGIHYAYAFAYVLWAASLMFVLATGGFLLRSREARSALNDELTVANRRFAYQAGYWMVMGTIVIFYVMSLFGEVTLPEALRLLFAFGVGMPAVAFAGRERRQSA